MGTHAYLGAGGAFTLGDDLHKIMHENKLDALTLDAKLGLPIAKEMPKVNVEQLPSLFDHDVVVVAISNAKHIGRNGIANTRQHKVVACLVVRVWRWVLLLHPLVFQDSRKVTFSHSFVVPPVDSLS